MAHALASELIDALKAADGEVDSLLATGWSGRAATSYEAAWRLVLDGGIDLIRTLMDSAESLRAAAADYGAQDSTTANRISTLNLG